MKYCLALLERGFTAVEADEKLFTSKEQVGTILLEEIKIFFNNTNLKTLTLHPGIGSLQ